MLRYMTFVHGKFDALYNFSGFLSRNIECSRAFNRYWIDKDMKKGPEDSGGKTLMPVLFD